MTEYKDVVGLKCNLHWHNITSFFNSMINILIFLFLDMPTLKRRIFIILSTDRQKIILLTARTTKN